MDARERWEKAWMDVEKADNIFRIGIIIAISFFISIQIGFLIWVLFSM